MTLPCLFQRSAFALEVHCSPGVPADTKIPTNRTNCAKRRHRMQEEFCNFFARFSVRLDRRQEGTVPRGVTARPAATQEMMEMEKDKAERCQGNDGQRNNSAKYFFPFLPRMLSGFPSQIFLRLIDFDKLHCKSTARKAAPKSRPEGNCCAQRR